MDRFDFIFDGVCDEFEKLAADSPSKKKADPATSMPPTPLEAENEMLSQQLENLSLKMQLRQAMQAQQAVAAQDQQAAMEEQMAAAGGQQGGDPSGGGGMQNPAMAASQPPALMPQSPQDMVGA